MIVQLRKALKSSWPLLITLGIYLLLVGLFSWMTPPFEGPDEPQHYAYIEWLVEQDDFPPQGRAAWDTPVQQESSQPPLYYLLAAMPARLIGVDNPRAEYRPNPYPYLGFALTYPDNDNRAVHYPEDASPLVGGWLTLYLARGVTVLFGLLLISSVYGLARAAMPNERQFAYSAALLVATIPQVVFLSGLVSNDIPVAAICTLLLWMLVVLIRKGSSPMLALVIGLVYGAASLMKASALLMFFAIGLTLLWLGFSRQQAWRSLFRSGFLIALGAILSAGWWYLRSWRLYGSPLGLETHDQAPWAINNPLVLGELSFRWLEVFRSFWLFLGWGTIKPRDEYYIIFMVLLAIAVVGLGIAFIRHRRSPRPFPDNTMAIFAILFVVLLVFGVFLEIWMRRVLAPYGRLLFPVIGASILILVLGWRAIHPKLPYLPIAITLTTSVLAPFLLLKPAYALPDFLAEDEAASKSTINWVFSETAGQPLAELLRVSPQERAVSTDTKLPIELCWRALDDVEQDFSIMVHIIGPNDSLISSRRTLPGLGRYPTSIWEPGAVWCDLLHMYVEENHVPRTLVYKIEVGMLDPDTDERLLLYDASGNPIEAGFAADVLIEKAGGDQALVLEADDSITLLEHNVGSRWQVGEVNPFSLVWAASTPLAADYQLFVHLRDRETGETIAQADGPPVNGWYPTSRWVPETRIRDDRGFPLPAEIEPGFYDLVVGFYDLNSGVRYGREYFLESIEIQR